MQPYVNIVTQENWVLGLLLTLSNVVETRTPEGNVIAGEDCHGGWVRAFDGNIHAGSVYVVSENDLAGESESFSPAYVADLERVRAYAASLSL